MFEDSMLDQVMEDRMSQADHYWEDDLYQYNQDEADDYRHDADDYDEFDEWEDEYDGADFGDAAWDEVD